MTPLESGSLQLALAARRIATITQELTELGATADARPDGLVIEGGALRAGVFKSTTGGF